MAPSKAPAEELEIAGHTVRLTSPDKIAFPRKGYTKRDVFEYYRSVGDGILRALRERPTTLQRFPDGIEGEMFFQKRIPTRGVPPWAPPPPAGGGGRLFSKKRIPSRGVPPWVQTAKISFPSGRTADELCPADL